MTAIRGYVPATDRPGLGVHSLDHFVLAVPDLAPAQRFYSDFGLDVQAAGDALGLKTAGHDQHWGVVVEGKRKKLHHLSFGCYSDDIVGLRLSDRSDRVAFMHAIHGSDHHILAFAQSSGPGLHHCSWDMSGIDDIGLGAMHMAGKGYSEGWGLGRHVLGSNYFHYVRDPWGSYAEYSCDIDYIPAEQNWQAGSHPPEDSFYLWGPEPPADFALNREL